MLSGTETSANTKKACSVIVLVHHTFILQALRLTRQVTATKGTFAAIRFIVRFQHERCLHVFGNDIFQHSGVNINAAEWSNIYILQSNWARCSHLEEETAHCVMHGVCVVEIGSVTCSLYKHAYMLGRLQCKKNVIH